jgi:hypothetical protein
MDKSGIEATAFAGEDIGGVIDRRRFLRAGMGVLAMPLLGGAGCGRGGVLAPDGGLCLPTGADIEGPFYRAGSPFRMDIAAGEPGERLFVGGVVVGPDCRTPLADAVVDVWQADSAGRYDNDGSRGPLGAGSSSSAARFAPTAAGATR